MTPFAGGSRFIQKGLLTSKAVLIFAIVLMLLGTVIGIYLTMYAGKTLLIIGAIGLFIGIFYTAPPLFLASLAIGEVAVFFGFGPICLLGSFYVQTSIITTEAILYSLPVGFLITAVLYINQFPDFEPDKKANKNNLVVRLGTKKACHGLVILFIATYLSIIIPVILGIFPLITLVSLLTSIIAVKAIKGLYKNHDKPQALIPSMVMVINTHLFTGILLIVSLLLS